MDINYKLTPELIANLKDLDNSFSNIYAEFKNTSQEELEAIHKYAKVSNIGSSTRIENALLTDVEINWIDTILTSDGKSTAFNQNKEMIENKLSKDRERSIEEVAGCRTMLMIIYANPNDFFPLTQNDLRALHYELLSPYSKAHNFAGKYKDQSNSVIECNQITKEERIIFETADPGPITSSSMFDLINWYNEALVSNPWPISVSAEFVYRFLAIHPFQDGNGRLGRGLFLLTMLHSKSDMIEFVSKYLPLDRYIEKNKEEYYFVLNKCSNGRFKQDPKEYKIEFFLKFMIKVIKEAIIGINECRDRYKKERGLSRSAKQVLDCFKDNPEYKLTTGKIIEKINLPRRTVIHALNSLSDLLLIQKYGQGSETRYQIVF